MKQFFLMGLAVLVLASCSNDQYDGPDYEGGRLSVFGTVNERISRAADTSWDANDQIGLYSDGREDNVLLTTTGDGTFISDNPIYVLGDGTTNYTAYYPYKESVSKEAPEISFDSPEDYMWATGTATREKPELKLQFSHKMSKVAFKISDSSTTETTKTGTIKITGAKTSGKFNTQTGVVTAGETSSELSKEFTLGSSVSFILPPQTGATIDVYLTIDGKTFVGSITPGSAAGTQYTYTIELNKNNASELAISAETITGWTPVEGGDIDVTEGETPKEPNVLEVGDFLLKNGTVIDKDDPEFESYKDQVAGVVYYVGNPQPSGLYNYNESQDILKAEHPSCTNGLAIAINNANGGTTVRFTTAKYDFAGWFKDEANSATAANYIATGFNLTARGDRMLGYNNTRAIEKITEVVGDGGSTGTGYEGTAAIVTAFNTSTEVTNASGWYIPSLAELNAVIENITAVSTSISKAGGTLKAYELSAENKIATENFYWTSDMRGNSYNWASPLFVPDEAVDLFIGRNSNGMKGYLRLSIAF